MDAKRDEASTKGFDGLTAVVQAVGAATTAAPGAYFFMKGQTA